MIPKAICDIAEAIRYTQDNVYKTHCESTIKSLRSSVKFKVPTDGVIVSKISDLKNDVKSVLRLPYPNISVEIPMSHGDSPFCICLAREVHKDNVSDVLRMTSSNATGAFTMSSVVLDPRSGKFRLSAFKVVALTGSPDQEDGKLLPAFPISAMSCSLSDAGITSDQAVRDYSMDLTAVMNLSLASMMSGAKETVHEKRKGFFKGKRGVKSEFFEYRTIDIQPIRGEHSEEPSTNEPRNGPRLHLRRGHVRKVSDTRLTWVRHAIVGDKSKGIIAKDYAIKKAGE